jgi:hypothetical protein
MPRIDLPSAPVAPSESLSKRIGASIRACPSGQCWSWRRRCWATVAQLVVCLALACLLLLYGFDSHPQPSQWAMAGTGLLGSCGALWLGLFSGCKTRVVKASAVGLPAIGFLVIVGLGQALGRAAADQEPVFGCLGIGALVALLPSLGMAIVWRGADAFSPRLSAAIVGSALALFGVGVLSLACGSADIVHLALAHGPLIVLGAGLSSLTADRWLAP